MGLSELSFRSGSVDGDGESVALLRDIEVLLMGGRGGTGLGGLTNETLSAEMVLPDPSQCVSASGDVLQMPVVNPRGKVAPDCGSRIPSVGIEACLAGNVLRGCQ